MKKRLINVLQGSVMGMAEVMPGISGSTCALIMGIYDDFILLLNQAVDFVKNFFKFLAFRMSFKDLKASFLEINFKFGVFLGIGILVSILGLSHIYVYFVDNYPEYVSAFFFGLMIASVGIPWKELQNKTYKNILIIIFTAVIVFSFLSLKPTTISGDPALPILFLGGVISITGSIMPGLSGSFVLIIFGIYDYVIGLIKSLTTFDVSSNDVLRIATFAVGMLTGFIIFLKLLKFLIEKHTNVFLSVIIGAMIGSLRVLYPFYEIEGENEEVHNLLFPWEVETKDLVICIVLALISFTAIMLLNRFGVDREQLSKVKVKKDTK